MTSQAMSTISDNHGTLFSNHVLADTEYFKSVLYYGYIPDFSTPYILYFNDQAIQMQ